MLSTARICAYLNMHVCIHTTRTTAVVSTPPPTPHPPPWRSRYRARLLCSDTLYISNISLTEKAHFYSNPTNTTFLGNWDVKHYTTKVEQAFYNTERGSVGTVSKSPNIQQAKKSINLAQWSNVAGDQAERHALEASCWDISPADRGPKANKILCPAKWGFFLNLRGTGMTNLELCFSFLSFFPAMTTHAESELVNSDMTRQNYISSW